MLFNCKFNFKLNWTYQLANLLLIFAILLVLPHSWSFKYCTRVAICQVIHNNSCWQFWDQHALFLFLPFSLSLLLYLPFLPLYKAEAFFILLACTHCMCSSLHIYRAVNTIVHALWACPHPTCYSILMQFDVGHGTLPTFFSICIVRVVKNASRRKTERERMKKKPREKRTKPQNQLPTVGQVAQGFAR